MDVYKETVEKLRKLRLNETQMSQEQFVRYASVLKKYRKEIIAGANQILRHFWLSGLLVEKDSQLEALRDSVQGIINNESAKGEMKRLKDILFQTYSLNKFLNAAHLVHCKILYEAYAPYWTHRCKKKPLPDGIDWIGMEAAGAVWYNSMIDMYWHDGYGIWVSEKEAAWRGSLPPTDELCEAEYEKEKRVMGNA